MATGVDVSKTRLDDLDRMVVRDSLGEPFSKKTVCNFGSGASTLSRALASNGHTVYNYDERDLHSHFLLDQALGLRSNFTQLDIANIRKHNLPKVIDFAVFQRVLHYLPYKEVRVLLERVTRNLDEEGRVYIALSGLESELGRGYAAADSLVHSRMGVLDEQVAKDFFIEKPVCLYTQTDAEQLVGEIDGLEIDQIWQSDFGNLKLVCRKTVKSS